MAPRGVPTRFGEAPAGVSAHQSPHATPQTRATRATPSGSGCYLTIAEVAAQLRCGQDKVLAWVNRKELEAINIANAGTRRPQWRIRPDDLAQFESVRSSRGSEAAGIRSCDKAKSDTPHLPERQLAMD